MRSNTRLVLVLGSLLALASCSPESPVQPLAADKADCGSVMASARTDSQTVINGFVVQYDGRAYDGEETTFNYTVFGAGGCEELEPVPSRTARVRG